MHRLAVLGFLIAACGPSIPPRYVIEENLGAFEYRRYQEVIDVEFPIEGNPAAGHTATYLKRAREGEELRVSTAFVTVYERGASLAAEVRDALEGLGTYEVAVRKVEGEWMWVLEGGEIPWVLWVSGRHLIKLGGSPVFENEADSDHYGIPEDLLEAYTDQFPSDLDERGQAREGTDSYGPSRQEAEESEELDIPSSLREGAPA
ncbi:MAG: hypothetical protein AAF411_19940 [Myxococcota bacterium]